LKLKFDLLVSKIALKFILYRYNPVDCKRVYIKLHDLASGRWVSNDTDVIDGKNKVFKTRFSKAGRILWWGPRTSCEIQLTHSV
jgi:hypothetical protein